MMKEIFSKVQDDLKSGGERAVSATKAAQDNLKGTDKKTSKASEHLTKNKTQKQTKANKSHLVKIEELTVNLNSAKDENLRLQAEIQNLHKRFAQELIKARTYGVTDFALALLDTVDNLENALSSFNLQNKEDTVKQEGIDKKTSNNSEESIYKGVDLTYKTLLDVLKKFNINEINPLGEKFNPEYHEALSKVKIESKESGSIVAVIQKGYIIDKRLLRAAKVQVAE